MSLSNLIGNRKFLLITFSKRIQLNFVHICDVILCVWRLLLRLLLFFVQLTEHFRIHLWRIYAEWYIYTNICYILFRKIAISLHHSDCQCELNMLSMLNEALRHIHREYQIKYMTTLSAGIAVTYSLFWLNSEQHLLPLWNTIQKRHTLRHA